MVCCRPDICPHISKLGQVLTAPAAIHYRALKAVAVYLIQTKKDGPIYWRRKPRLDLPKGDFKPYPIAPENLENSPWDPHGATALIIPHYRITPDEDQDLSSMAEERDIWTDSNWAGDLRHRRSMYNYVHMLFGMLIDYKTGIHPTICHSSAQAELAAKVAGGKNALYIRNMLIGLGIKITKPTRMWTDSVAVQAVEDATGTTKRLRHVEIAQFAVQDWKRKQLIHTYRVPSKHNPADLGSKFHPLTVHARLLPRIFCYHGPQRVRIPT
jgi:hypothetical protein